MDFRQPPNCLEIARVLPMDLHERLTRLAQTPPAQKGSAEENAAGHVPGLVPKKCTDEFLGTRVIPVGVGDLGGMKEIRIGQSPPRPAAGSQEGNNRKAGSKKGNTQETDRECTATVILS